jgi:hypothetical protein
MGPVFVIAPPNRCRPHRTVHRSVVVAVRRSVVVVVVVVWLWWSLCGGFLVVVVVVVSWSFVVVGRRLRGCHGW